MREEGTPRAGTASGAPEVETNKLINPNQSDEQSH